MADPMDARRAKTVHDPIRRTVGFVTPGSEPLPPVGLQQVIEAGSPTLVMIPPPQVAPRAGPDQAKHSVPISVPSIPSRPPPIPETSEPLVSPQETSSMTSSTASVSNKDYISIGTESILGGSPPQSIAPIAAAKSGILSHLGGSVPGEKPSKTVLSTTVSSSSVSRPPGTPMAEAAASNLHPPAGTAPQSSKPGQTSAPAPPAGHAVPPAELLAVRLAQGPVPARSPIRSPASSGPATPTSQGGGARVTGGMTSVAGSVQGGSHADGKGGGIKAKTTKAERRAQQEAQRAAKAASKEAGGGKPAVGAVQKETKGPGKAGSVQNAPRKEQLGGEKKTTQQLGGAGGGSVSLEKDKKSSNSVSSEKKKDMPGPQLQFDDEQKVAKARRKSIVEQTETKNRVELFRHLPQFERGTQLAALEAKFFSREGSHPHPAVYQVGLQYLTGDIVGGNARTIAMLHALREMIDDYATPPEKTLVRDLTAKINSQISFLIVCRPLAPGMGTAIRVLKQRIAKLPLTLPESEAKSILLSEIDCFVQEKIILADQEIVRHAVQKIRPEGDVLLTYGCSHVVELILRRAHDLGRRFRVIVVDSRPNLEGKEMLRRLLRAGIACTYARLNAVSYIMQEVSRVFLGAAAVTANGFVRSRVGSAAVGMVAHALRVPVLVCCETFKFHDRVQLDSITSNELGDPDQLVQVAGRDDKTALEGWGSNERLQLLNLKYDAMPPEYVTMIVTELGMLPPTSVPVILREYRRDTVLM